VKKVSARMSCCFFGRDTQDAPDDGYIEVEVTFPAFAGAYAAGFRSARRDALTGCSAPHRKPVSGE